jgi:hypothetical protein
VPPPPVAGATVGTGLGVPEWLGVADGLGLGLADEVAVGVLDGLTVGLPPALAVGVGEPDAPGEMGGGVAEGEDPEQAERAMEASIAKPAPAMADLALNPVPLTCAGLFITGI